MAIHATCQLVAGEAIHNALSFDGSNDGLTLGSMNSNGIGASGTSSTRYILWVRFLSDPSGARYLVKGGSATTGVCLGWSDNGGNDRLYVAARDGTNITSFRCDFTPEVDREYLIDVRVISNTTKEIWIDGSSQSVTTIDNTAWAYAANLTAALSLAIQGSSAGVLDNITGNPGNFTNSTNANPANVAIRYFRGDTWNGSAWVTGVEAYLDEGTGTPALAVGGGTVSFVDSPAWVDDFAAPIALTVTARAMSMLVNWSRWADWRSGFKAAIAGDHARYRYRIERSTTGAFAGEEIVLGYDVPSVSDEKEWRYFAEGTDPYTTPLDLDEFFKDDWSLQDAQTYYYRVRIEEFDAGDPPAVAKSGRWSLVASAAYDDSDRPSATLTPAAVVTPPNIDPRYCRVLFRLLLAGSGTVARQMSATALLGPSAWRDRCQVFLDIAANLSGVDRRTEIGFSLRGPGGHWAVDDGTGSLELVSQAQGKHSEVGDAGVNRTNNGFFRSASLETITDNYEAGVILGGSNGTALRDILENYELYMKEITDQGSPVITYCYGSRTMHQPSHPDVYDVTQDAHVVVSQRARTILGMDTVWAVEDAVDFETGHVPAAAAGIAAIRAAFPGTQCIIEAAGGTDESDHWIDNGNPDLVFTAGLNTMFTETLEGDGSVSLALKAGKTDPTTYPGIPLILWIDSTYSTLFNADPTIPKGIKIAKACLEYSSNIVVKLGTDGTWNSITAEQMEELLGYAGTTGRACPARPPQARGTRILLAEEEEFGVYSTDPDLTPVRVPIRSESLDEDPGERRVLHSIAAGVRPAVVTKLGRRHIAGEIVTELCTNGWGPLLLKHATSAAITSNTVGPTHANHSAEAGATADLPPGLSVDKVIAYQDGTYFNQRFLGCRVDSLDVSIQKGRAVELRTQLIGRQRTELTTMPSERFAAGDRPIMGDEFVLFLDRDGDTIAESFSRGTRFSFTLTNGLGRNAYAIAGGGLRDRVPQGRRNIAGRVQAVFSAADEQLLDRWLDGDIVGVRALGTMREDEDQFVEFDFPAAVITGNPVPKIAGRGLIRFDFGFVAAWDAAAGYDFRWEIQNRESGVSTGNVTRL